MINYYLQLINFLVLYYHTMNFWAQIKEYEQFILYFTLHTLTILVALVWSFTIEKHLDAFPPRTLIIFAVSLTIASMFMHSKLSKYAKKPKGEPEI